MTNMTFYRVTRYYPQASAPAVSSPALDISDGEPVTGARLASAAA